MAVDAVIIGMGYVGPPLAQAAVMHCLSVVGLDVEAHVTAGLNSGRSHVDDLSDADVAEMLSRGFRATTDPRVIDGAKTKPFGFQAFCPGAGVGGHCTPIDLNCLSYDIRARLGYPFRFAELAQEVNQTAPHYVAQRAQQMPNDIGKPTNGVSILLLGVSYKPNIADDRESPARLVVKQLLVAGAQVRMCDPRVPHLTLTNETLGSEAELRVALQQVDLTILLQPHEQYDVEFLVEHSQLLFDSSERISAGPGVERL